MSVVRSRVDRVSVARLVRSDVELVHASYRTHRFARHTHDSVAVGVIDAGVGAFWCRGANHVVPTDSLVLIDPGEVHDGGIGVGGTPVNYRMMYLPFDLVRERFEIPGDWPGFTNAAPSAPEAAAELRRLHAALASAPAPDAENALLARVAEIVSRFLDRGPRTHRAPGRTMSRVRDHIHANASSGLTLTALASLVRRSPCYVNRRFRQEFGLPPRAYQLQLRLQRSKQLLEQGRSIAFVAAELAFVDQSHFTRAFKRWFGMTPGDYRAASHSRS